MELIDRLDYNQYLLEKAAEIAEDLITKSYVDITPIKSREKNNFKLQLSPIPYLSPDKVRCN